MNNNILISSAGRRVELLNYFKAELTNLNELYFPDHWIDSFNQLKDFL